jgi:hypothetical protein
MQVREKGFKVQAAVRETALPVYDSFRDPYCPWARALEHNIWQDRRAGALLEGAAPQQAAKTAHAETARRLQPLRETIIKDRWTLPTVPTLATPAAAAADPRSKPSETAGVQNTRNLSTQSDNSHRRPTTDGSPLSNTHETMSPTSSPKAVAGGADDAPLKLTWQESLESEVREALYHLLPKCVFVRLCRLL